MEDSEKGNVKHISGHVNYIATNLTQDDLSMALDETLDRFRASLTYYEIIGVLQHAVCMESIGNIEWDGD